MEINFRNVNINSQNIKNLPAKSDSNTDNFNYKEPSKAIPGQIQSLSISTAKLQFNVLTKMQQSVLIRDLLNLPKEIKELLDLLSFTAGENPDILKTADELNQLILISDIQNILNTNSKELLNKLLKLIQPTPGNIQNFEQLKEIISTIQKMIPGANASNNEILKNVILLYLPWLPLTQPQDISIEYEKKQTEEKEEENITLVLFITTENIGRLKGIIGLDKNYNLNVKIESLNYNEDIKDYLQIINTKINDEIKQNKIPAKTEIDSYKCKELKKSERREVSVQSGSGISPKVMMAAFIVTKVIFELDESITLKKKRKKMVQQSETSG